MLTHQSILGHAALAYAGRFIKERSRTHGASAAIRDINTLTILKVVKAEPDLSDAAARVRWGTQAEGRVHLANHGFGPPCQSELDWTAAQVRLELMDGQQDPSIHLNINTADSFAIAAGGDLRFLQQGS